MSVSYTLRDDGGGAYLKIVSARKWVGRVYRNRETNKWHGHINTPAGKHECPGWYDTSKEAFDETVATHLGYPTAAALREHNSGVRAVQSARKKRINALAQRMFTGDINQTMDAIDELLGKKV